MAILVCSLVIGCCALFCSGRAWASMLAVGVHAPDLYVQEYWIDGVPSYLLANLADTPRSVVLRPCTVFDDGVRVSVSEPGPIVQTWSLEPHETRIVDAHVPEVADFIRFYVDGENAGLAMSMRQPPVTDSAGFISDSSANYRGGIPGSGWITVCDRVRAKSGEEVRVRLQAPPDAELLIFGDLLDIVDQKGELHHIDDPARFRFPVPVVVLDEVLCESARVQAVDNVVCVDFDDHTDRGTPHEIELRFHMPEVDEGTPVLLNAQADSRYRGGYVFRLFVVEP